MGTARFARRVAVLLLAVGAVLVPNVAVAGAGAQAVSVVATGVCCRDPGPAFP